MESSGAVVSSRSITIERGYPDDYESTEEVGRVIVHPEYDYSGAGFKNDAAIVELLKPFQSVLAVPVEILTKSVVAWIGVEMEFALSQAIASGDAFEHRPSECGHCVQDFLAELDLRDLPGEAAGFELGADDALPAFDSAPTATAPLPPVALCQAIPSSLRIWATARSPLTRKSRSVTSGSKVAPSSTQKIIKILEVNENKRVGQEPRIPLIATCQRVIRQYAGFPEPNP